METLVALGMVVLLFAAIAGGIAGLIQGRARSNTINPPSPTGAPVRQPSKADQLAYSKKKYLFSAAERSFYEVLKRLVPPEYTVFAKVRLADLVYVSKGAADRQSHFNRI